MLQPGIPPLPTIEALSSRVVRILGLNPGAHTLQGTNTYLVGSGAHRILIDTGEGRSGYAKLLEEAVKQAGAQSVHQILLTHNHYDHVGGLEQVREKYGSHVPAYKRIEGVAGGQGGLVGVKNLEEEKVFKTEGATLRVIYTPGHTDDHVCFWLEEEDALFSADCILGHGTTVFDDLHDYMQSLNKLLQISRGQVTATGNRPLKKIYPGHGAVIETQPIKVIENYISHRTEREEQIYETLLKQGASSNGLTPLQIVHEVYHQLPPQVIMSAQWNVEHHLDKLKREGRVMPSSLGKWKATTFLPGSSR